MFPPASCRKLSLVSLILMAGCRHADVARSTPPRLGPSEEILVDSGDSAQASYSTYGDRLVFVSAKRPGHVQPQVYVRDAAGVERRVTFSNGGVENPRFHPREPLVVYASSTDELKEYPPLLRSSLVSGTRAPASLAQPMEIYVHNLVTFDIERLTTHDGYDGEPRFSGDGASVTWTEMDHGRARVVAINRFTKARRTLQSLGTNPADYVVAADGLASAWLDYDLTFQKSKLNLRRDKQTREIASERPNPKTDLAFSSDGRWLFWAEQDPKTGSFRPVSFDLENDCVREVPFAQDGSRRDPVLSPDSHWLTYTLVGKDKSRIARSPFDTRPGPCANPP